MFNIVIYIGFSVFLFINFVSFVSITTKSWQNTCLQNAHKIENNFDQAATTKTKIQKKIILKQSEKNKECDEAENSCQKRQRQQQKKM